MINSKPLYIPNFLSGGLLPIACILVVSITALSPSQSSAQADRWFTFEVSIFSNENPADRLQEPPIGINLEERQGAKTKALTELYELLAIPDYLFNQDASELTQDNFDTSTALIPLPEPLAANESSFVFSDLERDAFIALPNSLSDFQQTNRALERSPDYRLLYHAIWRQPLANKGDSIPLEIEGGIRANGAQELTGTLDFYFNARRDRIVLDTDLTLTSEQAARYFIHRQSREMRSDEFHYLDSPAIGVIFIAQPYEVPPLTSD